MSECKCACRPKFIIFNQVGVFWEEVRALLKGEQTYGVFNSFIMIFVCLVFDLLLLFVWGCEKAFELVIGCVTLLIIGYIVTRNLWILKPIADFLVDKV